MGETRESSRETVRIVEHIVSAVARGDDARVRELIAVFSTRADVADLMLLRRRLDDR
ncbi:hypothetical protein [Embleya sp. AB8]|uniref:hypothetical protein n=1 Tax=Embleya sp. AB8 TaxID=3156304 RepID=UPI003C70FD36